MEEEMKTDELKISKKKSLKERARRYLVWFVALIVICTIISRATASVTVPMVSVTNPHRGYLSFKINGRGFVEASNEQYVDVQAGMQISQVHVKMGEIVAEGEPLFEYDLEAINDQIKKLQEDLNTKELNYKKTLLTDSTQDSALNTDTEEKTYNRAKEDYEEAEKDLNEAKAEYKEKTEEIIKTLNEQQKKDLETAQEAYNTAQENYTDTDEACKEAYEEAKKGAFNAATTKAKMIADATEVLQQAQDALKEYSEKRDKLVYYMDDLKTLASNQDISNCEKTIESIMQEYFGKKEYRSMMRELDSMENSYQKAVATSDSEGINVALLNIKHFNEDHDDYVAIKKAATDFKSYYIVNPKGDDQTAYTTLYNLLINDTTADPKKYEELTKDVTKKETALKETITNQEDAVQAADKKEQDLKEDWTKKLAKAQKAIDDAKKGLDELLENDYSGKDKIELALQAVMSAEDAKKRAKRTLEDAKESLEAAKEKIAIDNSNASIQKEKDDIDKRLLEDSIEDIKEQIATYNDLLKTKGTVIAKVGGMITALGVQPKSNTSGQELVSIAPNSCIFEGSFSKDDSKYVEVGAVIQCSLDTLDKDLDAEIISMNYNQETNNYSFTAQLPEGEYVPHTAGTFTYTKQSEKYDCVIPITALVKENENYYVLVIEETETILGVEKVASKMSVTVTDKDTQNAAVTGIYADVEVITGSNRNISGGDRVREGNYE